MNTYAYLRVSTDIQEHGQDAQRAAISKAVDVDEWFYEEASGKDTKGRPVFTALLDRVCQEQACLVVSKLDRLGRSVTDVLQMFERVHSCGASIKVLDMGIDTTTPVGKLMLTILAGFAEFEREMIRQRTREGLAAAKEKGVTLGRPKTWNDQVIMAHVSMGWTDEEVAEHVGCSARTVARTKKKLLTS